MGKERRRECERKRKSLLGSALGILSELVTHKLESEALCTPKGVVSHGGSLQDRDTLTSVFTSDS